MSKIWGSMLIVSIIIAIVSANAEVVIDSIVNSGKDAVENVITLIGMMCFWGGIFRIFEKTQVIKSFSKFFSKVLSFVFHGEKMEKKTKEYVSLNVASNIVGIGNAATINGVKAMESLQDENPNKKQASDNMAIFVLLNTASLQLIPTSMIALRSLYHSDSPTSIVFPIWVVTLFSLIAGMISIKILNKRM